MADNLAILNAVRSRAATLVAATTGSTTLESTATGYARTAGSFVADGFYAGMEVTPSGFAHSTPGLINRVTDLTLTIDGGRPVEAAAPARQLLVGLPAIRLYENVGGDLIDRRWAVDEDYLPGPRTLVTMAGGGEVDLEPVYVLKVYGVAGRGPEALYRLTDELLELFAPASYMVAAGGAVVRVRGQPAPYRGQLIPEGAGHALITVTIPLWVRAANIT